MKNLDNLLNKIKTVRKNRKALTGAAVAGVSCLVIAFTVQSARIQSSFDPSRYGQQDKYEENAVSYDDVVFNSELDGTNGKELDQNAGEDVSLNQGDDEHLMGDEDADKNELQLSDGSQSGDTDQKGNGYTVSQNENGQTLVLPGSGGSSGTGTGNSNTGSTQDPSGSGGDSGNTTTPPASEDGSGTGENPGGGNNPGGGDKPDKPDDSGDSHDSSWSVASLSAVSNFSGGNYIPIYTYMSPQEYFVKTYLTVTATWKKGSQTKTETTTAYTVEVPEEYQHVFGAEDVEDKVEFPVTISFGGKSVEVTCRAATDFVSYSSLRVVSQTESLNFYEGETFTEERFKKALKLQATAVTQNGHTQLVFDDFTDYTVEFATEQAQKGTEEVVLRVKSSVGVNIPQPYVTVKYHVYSNCLQVKDYDGNNLQTIYTDESTVNLTDTYDGNCPYRRMIEALKKDGKYSVTQEGYLSSLFLGWTVLPGETSASRVSTVISMSKYQHLQSVYPFALQPILENGYLVREENGAQVLVGYRGTEAVLSVPYGVTSVRMDASFVTTAAAKEKVTSIVFSDTVTDAKLSHASELLPKVAGYEAGAGNLIFQTDAQGILYKDAGTTMVKCPNPKTWTVTVSENVEKISAGALEGSARAAAEAGEKLLVLCEGENPPALSLTSGCELFRIQVPETRSIQPKEKSTEQIQKVENLYLKRYCAAWGSILDQTFEAEGAAMDLVLFTEAGAEKQYTNVGNVVLQGEKALGMLAFAPSDAGSSWQLPSYVKGIAAYAFYDTRKFDTLTLTENIVSLEENCLALGATERIAAINITGSQKISMNGRIFGDIAEEDSVHLFVSAEQEKNSGWMEHLSADYDEQTAKNVLVVTEAVPIVMNGCIYSQDAVSKNLTLYAVPKSAVEYQAPEKLTKIEKGAFSGCAELKLLELPEVTEISDGAFTGCSGLEILVLPSGQITEVGEIFTDCTALEDIVTGSAAAFAKVPEWTKLRDTAAYLFENGIVYEKLTDGGYAAVNGISNITGTVALKDGTTQVKAEAFAGCTQLDGFQSGSWKKLQKIGDRAFSGCTSLKQFTGTAGACTLYATVVGEEAFRNCTSLTSLEITGTDGVMELLGDRAFEGCQALETVVWTADSKAVGEQVFAGLSGLKRVVYGVENLGINNPLITTTGNATFQDCGELGGVYFFAPIQVIGDYTFDQCIRADIVISNSSVSELLSIGAYAFRNCQRFSRNFSPALKLTEIGEGAFMECTDMDSPTLPPNVERIPDYCFAGCTRLTRIYMSANAETYTVLKEIGEGAFSGCTSLQYIYNMSRTKIETVGVRAFSASTVNGTEYGACSKLLQVEFPDTLKEIREGAFQGDTSLQEIVLTYTEELEQVGASAFEGCENLSEMLFGGTKVTELSESVFAGCSKLQTVTLSENFEKISSAAFQDCGELASVMIQNSDQVLEVSADAFDGITDSEGLKVYVPATEGKKLYGAYVSSAQWSTALTGRQEEIITEWDADKNTLIVSGGIYRRLEDQTYQLVSVLPSAGRTFVVQQNTNSIAPEAFAGCSNLEIISVSDKVKELPDGLFQDCTSLQALLFNAYDMAVPKLQGTLFGKAQTPSGLRIYADETMQESIQAAFPKIQVESYGSVVQIFQDVLYGGSDRAVVLLHIPKSYEGELAIRTNTTVIADRAGENCKSLTGITSQVTVQSIGERAFAGCTSLKYLFLTSTTSTKLATIGAEAFKDCTSLVGNRAADPSKVTIPISVAEIGEGAFENCTSLLTLSNQSRVSTFEISDRCFYGCTSMIAYSGSAYHLPAVKRIGKEAFYGCENLTTLSWTNMPNLEEIGDSAYENCTGIIMATFAEKLEKIGDRAFYGTSLQGISFNGKTPPSIGKDIMSEEGQQKVSVYVPNKSDTTVVSAYQSAWGGAYPILASRVQGLDGDSFRMVSSVLYVENVEDKRQITSIKVPTTLSSISFYNGTGTNPYCVGIGDYSVSGNENVAEVEIPVNVRMIGRNAFEDCTALGKVTFNTTLLTTIGEEAFKNCTSLGSLTLKASVTSIGDRVFEGCTSFQSLYLESAVPFTLGDYIFGDTVEEGVHINIPYDSYELYMEVWGAKLDAQYGEGTAIRLFVAESDDGTKRIGDGIVYTMTAEGWIPQTELLELPLETAEEELAPEEPTEQPGQTEAEDPSEKQPEGSTQEAEDTRPEDGTQEAEDTQPGDGTQGAEDTQSKDSAESTEGTRPEAAPEEKPEEESQPAQDGSPDQSESEKTSSEDTGKKKETTDTESPSGNTDSQ